MNDGYADTFLSAADARVLTASNHPALPDLAPLFTRIRENAIAGNTCIGIRPCQSNQQTNEVVRLLRALGYGVKVIKRGPAITSLL